jgi:hypothetical protein
METAIENNGDGRNCLICTMIRLKRTAQELLKPARTEVAVQIDKLSPRLTVSSDGFRRHDWPVSTGRRGGCETHRESHPRCTGRDCDDGARYLARAPLRLFR